MTMIVLTVIFGKLAKLPSGGAPYAVLVFSAMLPWQYFAGSLSESSDSLISNNHLISKVYFPRVIIPVSTIFVGLIELLISFSVLVLLMLWYGIIPGWRMLTLPFFVLIVMITSSGAGLWFSALNVRYRDFRYIIPFIVQFGLYISPVGFSSIVVPVKWRFLYSINPLVGSIDGFRWAILGGANTIYWPGFILSLLAISVLFFSGLWYFRKTERTFADII